MIEKTHPSYRPDLRAIMDASRRITGVAVRTPLLSLRWYEENPNILLKPEMLQPIGSYKIRGIYNLVTQLSPMQRKKGISTYSSGNMAQAVGYVAKMYNIPAKVVVVGETVSEYKISLMKRCLGTHGTFSGSGHAPKTRLIHLLQSLKRERKKRVTGK